MTEYITPQPAPYDWHAADKYMPNDGEIVSVYQLWGWAAHDQNGWMYVDRCGNRGHLAWKPEFWRRQYYPSDPVGSK